MTAAAAPVSSGSQGEPNQTAATGSGASTSAETHAQHRIASSAVQREPTEAP